MAWVVLSLRICSFQEFLFHRFHHLAEEQQSYSRLTIVTLMVDANIPDIKHRDVHEQLQEKFRLKRKPF